LKVYILDEGSKSLEEIILWLSGNRRISEVEVYGNCTRFISRVREFPPTLCMIRLGQEEKYRLKTARIIKDIDPNILIVFISGELNWVLDTYETGAKEYLLCPMDRAN